MAGQPPVCPHAFRDRPPLCTPCRVNQLRPKLRLFRQPYRRSRRHPGCTRRKKGRLGAAGEVPSTVSEPMPAATFGRPVTYRKQWPRPALANSSTMSAAPANWALPASIEVRATRPESIQSDDT